MYSAIVPPKPRNNQCISVDLGNTIHGTKIFFCMSIGNIILHVNRKYYFVCQSRHSPDFDKTKLCALFTCKSRFSRCWPGNGEKPEGFLGGQDLFAFCTLSSEWAASLAPVDSISHFLSTPLIFPCSHADIVIWTHSRKFSCVVCCQITVGWCEIW